MNLRPIKANMTELDLNNGETLVLFSYKTPVASRYVAPSGKTRLIKTEKFWSVTTSRHINTWVKEFGAGANVEMESQNFIDGLVK